MRYVLAIYRDETLWEDLGAPESKAILDEYLAVDRELADKGVLVACEALEPSATTQSVRVRGGERLVTDGPFARTKETREALRGVYVLECANLDEAIGWAAKLPAVRFGWVEVRSATSFDA